MVLDGIVSDKVSMSAYTRQYMKIKSQLKTYFIMWISMIGGLNADTLTLHTNYSPPYQISKSGELAGTSIDALDCIFHELRQPYQINLRPWLRSISEVQKGISHGFFTSTFIDELENVATLSSPLFLERWYWYYTKPELVEGLNASKNLLVGAVRGSAQSIWLQSKKSYDVVEVNSQQQLVKLLELGRIEAVVADRKSFRSDVSSLGRSMDAFQSNFIKYAPMGVYFSSSFLEEHPVFLSNFNGEIHHCISDTIPLNNTEIEKLNVLLSNSFSVLLSDIKLINYLKNSNKPLEPEDRKKIQDLDVQWKKERVSLDRPFIDKLMSQPFSKRLRKLQNESNGAFTEIFLTNNHGILLGASEITSDYWQGDEAKFKNTQGKSGGTFSYNDIIFDESTGLFQTQVGVSIGDSNNNDYLGTLIIGVNPAEVLKATHPFESSLGTK